MPLKKNVTAVVVTPPLLLPASYQNVVSNAPLASSLLSGYTVSRLKRRGKNVHYFDAALERDLSSFEKNLTELPMDEIYVNLVYAWENTEKILEALGRVRSATGAKLFLFGYFPTFHEKELRRYSFIDGIIPGDPLHEAKGDKAPFPSLNATDCAPLLGSRGCWGRCTFCYAGRFFKGYQGRLPEDIVDEIEQRLREGFQRIYFVDACFFPPGRRAAVYAEELAGEIRRRRLDFRFGLECRPDSISEETLEPLKEVGLSEIFLGVESGCQSILDRFQKGTTVEQNERAIRLIRERGIKLSTGFIMFDPEVRLPELRENFYFLERNGLLDCATNAAQLLSHKVFLYAGTPLYKKFAGQPVPRAPRPYFIDYPFQDKNIQRIYGEVESESAKIYERFRGQDIDNPEMAGSWEAAREFSAFFQNLLEER